MGSGGAEGVGDLFELGLGERNLLGVEVLLEMGQGGGAGDEDDVWGAMEEPGESECCGTSVEGLRERRELRMLCERGFFGERLSGEGAPWEERDPVCVAMI